MTFKNTIALSAHAQEWQESGEGIMKRMLQWVFISQYCQLSNIF